VIVRRSAGVLAVDNRRRGRDGDRAAVAGNPPHRQSPAAARARLCPGARRGPHRTARVAGDA
jgi:hypothetical protein